MSLSFRKPAMKRLTGQVSAGAALLSGAVLSATSAHAAQVYVQPIISTQVQSSTNLGLDPGVDDRTESYSADAATLIGIATPSSDTTLKPRLQYRDYSDASRRDRLEAFLDLSTLYTGQRSSFLMFGRYEHRDEANAEKSAAQFDDVTPDAPTDPETGRIQNGATRDMVLLAPTYKYKLTQRTDIGASATVQTLDYSPDDVSRHVDYRYYEGKGFVGWELSQRTSLSLGGYASKYEAENIDATTDSVGASAEFEWDWSAVLESSLALVYQRSDVERTEPFLFEDKTNAWGANFKTVYKGQVSRTRLNVGRTITPSGTGGLLESDNVRLQFERDLTPRWELTAAGRYLRNRALTDDTAGNDRDYRRVELGLRWMVTRTWFVEGAYEYTWQKYENDSRSADDNSFALKFGYRGLPRQR
jgi:hypothetical protein